ncbi:MAG: RdgB/HAM1 family non-canonical purine NTP pyrophosphatase [Bacteroidales bacterium]|nr:RdgB/HAM1 family non-canonical purine NTP pyrophosphatase [Bacteroidales bacterium]
MELIFASNNRHKLEEISKIAGDKFSILNLKQANCEGEIPETGETLAENALQKARWVYERTGKNCFADDTGLEIDALNGAPGVYTARFAGENCTPKDNIIKTLALLEGEKNRKACFKTVIACIIDGKEYLFNGEVEGDIATEEMGEGGFGYDPIFIPKGFDVSFAQMPLDQKNKMSHRGRATAKFIDFIQTLL